jgi:hypothetical protein
MSAPPRGRIPVRTTCRNAMAGNLITEAQKTGIVKAISERPLVVPA